MHKISSSTNAPYGTPPSMRSVESLLESGIVVINKQAGPSSHQVAAWVRDSFGLETTGHGGTLDVDYGNGVGIVDVNNVGSMDQRLETGIVILSLIHI